MSNLHPNDIQPCDLQDQRAWSWKTFGPPRGDEPAAGVLDHIMKELDEIRHAEPGHENEWIDVLILVLDGAMREGHDPEDIFRQYHAKMDINRNRQWPDWRDAEPGKAIEHIRDGES